MTAPGHDDELDRTLAELRSATPPPAAYAALRRARSGDEVGPPVRRRRVPAGRTLALALTGLAVAGTATAAVTASGPFDGLRDSATADAPAARNLGSLLASRGALPERLGAGGGALPGTGPRSGAPPSGAARGLTVRRDGVSVDIAFDDRNVCLATPGGRTLRVPGDPVRPRKLPGSLRDQRATIRRLPPLGAVLRALPSGGDRSATARREPRLRDALRALARSRDGLGLLAPASLACFPATASADTLPSVVGIDGTRIWLAAVVPDDVTDVRVTDARGRTVAPKVDRNVVIAVFRDSDRLARITWTAPDGRRVVHSLRHRRQQILPFGRPTVPRRPR